MMCGRIIRTVLSTALAAACACTAHAGSVESSYRTARAIIAESMESTGATAWLDHGGAILIESHGTWNLGVERQGYTPDDPSPIPLVETWAFHPLQGMLGREVRYNTPDGTNVWQRELFIGDRKRVVVDHIRETATVHIDQRLVGLRSALLRRWIPTLLAELEDNPSSLRASGRYGPFDGVQAVTHDGSSLSLFFGRESRHLGWVEYLTDIPTYADSTVSWKYSDYQSLEGLGDVPHAWAILVNEAVLAEMTVRRVTRDRDEVESFLAIPERLVAAPDPRQGPRIEPLAKGLWRVTDSTGNHHVLAIDLGESLLLIDAPAPRPALFTLPARNPTGESESALTRDIVDALESVVPGKRIGAVALTHFHAEHAGGLLALASMGAKIMALASEAPAVEEFLGREHTLCEITSGELSASVQPIEQRLELGDGDREVILLDVGANPHTAGMLVVWLPQSGVLYLSDLMTSINGAPDPAQNRMNRFVAHWLKSSGIQPQRILTAHGDGELRAPEWLGAVAARPENTPAGAP